jgi:iron complex transport system permease protein
VLGYLLTRADVRDAQSALLWLVGSLSGARWSDIAMLGVAVVVLLVLVALLAPRLRILQLGEQSATSLGVAVQPARLAILATAVALTAVATATVGPIAFVAFVAAPIARRLVGGLALVPTALVGALLVIGSDFVGQHLLPGDLQVPVGIITGAVGAPYLLWLLAVTNRRGESR